MKHTLSTKAKAKSKLDQTVCFRISKHDFDRFVNLIRQTRGSSTSPMAREVFAAGLDALGAPPPSEPLGSTPVNPLLEQISRQLPLEDRRSEPECEGSWCTTFHGHRKAESGA